MKTDTHITFDGDHILVISEGKKDIRVAAQIWKGVSELSRKHDCFRVLGVANSTNVETPVDSDAHVRIFDRLHETGDYRVAWVEHNPRAFETIQFIVNVLRDAGYVIQLFPGVDRAKAWLLDAS